MPDLNTNDLYNMIAANKAEADKISAAAKAEPTFVDNFGSTLRSQDATLSSAVGNYSDAVAQLFAHDKTMAASQIGTIGGVDPTMVNPMIKENYGADLFAKRGQVVADSLKTLETRKAILGDVVDKATKMYESIVAGKQADYNANKDALASALDILRLEETKRSNLAQENIAAEGKTLTAKKLTEAKNQLINDAQNGATLADIIDTYKDSLTAAEIKDLYENNSSWGKKINETDAEFNRMYQSAKKGAGAMDTFAALPTSVKKEVDSNISTTIVANDLLNTLAAKMGNRAPEFWTALANNDVGKLAALTRPFRNDADLMGMIDSFQAGVRQKVYGSAFTATEAELAKRWLAEGSDQANQIWSKLLGQSKIAQKQLRTTLKSKGYSDAEIDRNLQRAGYQDVVGTSTNGSAQDVNSYLDKYFK